LDQTGEFAAECCNRTDVDLEPVSEAKDIEILHRMIKRHAELTSSPQANWILKTLGIHAAEISKGFPA